MVFTINLLYLISIHVMFIGFETPEVGVKYHVHAKEHEETMMYQLFKVVPKVQSYNYEVLKK